jgi:hypothetical protein
MPPVPAKLAKEPNAQLSAVLREAVLAYLEGKTSCIKSLPTPGYRPFFGSRGYLPERETC